MNFTDIPPAAGKDVNNSTSLPEASDYESQKKACIEAIGKITDTCSSSSVVFHGQPCDNLISEIEEKGYRITYTLDYDTTRNTKFMCRLRITNPSIKDPGTTFMNAFEDNMKKLGFNTATVETEENFKKLFNNIMNL